MPRPLSLKLWLIGLMLFALVITFDRMVLASSAFNVLDHQAAATAVRVDEIQGAWSAENLKDLFLAAMLGDILFIFVYSWGSWRVGQTLSVRQNSLCRTLGLLVSVSAALFFVADIVETSLQIAQMLLDRGVEWMAGVAAFAQPVKVTAFLATFFGVILGLIANRLA